MASQSSAAGGRGAGMSVTWADRAVLAAAAHLTSRDRRLVRAVAKHRVLTTGQLAALGFGSVITARHRLAVLVEPGVLRRFRPHRDTGSAPWHYLLGPVGAALLGAEDASESSWLKAVRADRQLALERSQRLAHLVGVNWFFAALAAFARTTGSGAELRLWLGETGAAGWLQGRAAAKLAWEGPPRPDGLGCWAELGQQVTFMLEYDTGSEHLPQLAGTLAGYSRLARAMADVDQPCPLLLFCFLGPRREQAARQALAAATEAAALRIATAALNPEHASPAGPVWLPLLPGWAGGPVALCVLDAALPDPWSIYRAEHARAREQAAQAHVPPPWPADPDDEYDSAGPAPTA
ncbi:MAG TPA: replication-relaxation family protein [Streptosporangiaceae bacterium]|nr:replication-relaxation family protein [Streptosporangiaceae bacterium]